ncbi:MAG TPA: DNA-3-methyladenine glycosylase I [Myxococcota bacterium]|nr:DNA-3-methyladenine glycosylase I [Myxococcota bacterium]
MITKKRCPWADSSKPYYVDYHDHEWGVPVHDDRKLFEMLILEGAQAGLSWETILKRRDGYKKAFKNFDAEKIVKMTDPDLEGLMLDESIIRNRLKIFSVRKNAQAFLAIRKEFGSFDEYLWRFVGKKTLVNRPKTTDEIPDRTKESDALAKDLKKRGMSFVGSTIIYAFMQAVGMVDDHVRDCFKAKKP